MQTVKQEGKIVYAYQQTAICDGLLDHCKLQWEKYKIDLLTLHGFEAKVMVECYPGH